jgi:hypothetical protein
MILSGSAFQVKILSIPESVAQVSKKTENTLQNRAGAEHRLTSMAVV